ncbi:Oxysterol-binding protein-related protein 6 [Papilio machaon]|uniref:Oxysterol-binding protein-related protein 6 n=1 Tax=Papilio machaon TaxID=76193 RepID=A0A194QTJ1_PAPMA|nr:Oxysterol-binding protein-related protein 6 [Papilio machaon]
MSMGNGRLGISAESGSRRRAGGRAAALRRAPSDSDCSGETASLSADSAERAPRAPPQPTRQTKTRGSRRRGSEWEVLEGLKDGQRFEKRPEVFNGYLHKKRKWPLKGWHKRFFVVDGGILVYARSPSDVARGRLHGSVDVGLSVISAKARRRRIDIDADEFIYHLRAKTPDVFRTWLYRQHLLTFGARESVPKIHAPLEDLPTETSSHWLARKRTRTICSSSDGEQIDSLTSSILSNLIPPKAIPSNTSLTHKTGIKNKEITSLKCIYSRKKNNSMDKRIVCCFKRVANSKELTSNKIKEANISCINDENSDDAQNNPEERHMHTTNLDVKTPYLESLMSMESLYLPKQKSNSSYRKTIPNFQIIYKRNEENKLAKTSKDAKVVKNEPIVFCFTHKHRSCRTNAKAPLLKRSRKSTNMVKYRNVLTEPPLKQPLNKRMLLGKYKLKISRHSDARPARVILLNQNHNEASNENNTNIKKDEIVDTEFNKITEKLVETVFENYNKFENYRSEDHIRSFINRVIAEIYCFSCEQIDDHPVKALFKCLLEYWIQKSSFPHLKETVKAVKSISKPSNYYFTKDQKTSSLCVKNQSKETQCHDCYDTLRKKKSKHSIISNPIGLVKLPKTESFNKEQKIQELERMIKNTVYYCDNTRTEPRESKQDDIQITKILIENIGKDNSNQSTNKFNKMANEGELIELQKVINYLLSETSLPVDMAREIFKAYLNILKNESVDEMSSSLSMDIPKNIEPKSYNCDVLTDCVQKHISKNIMTQSFQDNISFKDHLSLTNVSEIHLYNVLNKITFKSDNVKIPWDRNTQKEKIKEAMQEYRQFKDPESTFKIQPDTNEVSNKSRVLYLSQYNLEHITTDNVPLVKERMSIAFKVDNNTEATISKPDYVLQNNDDPCKNIPQPLLPIFDYKTDSDRLFSTIIDPKINYYKNPYMDLNYNTHENISIKPFCSSETLSNEWFNKIYEKRWEINDMAYVISDNSNITRLSSDVFRKQSNVLTLVEKEDDLPNTSKNTDEVVKDFQEKVNVNSADKKEVLHSFKSKLSDIIDEEFKKLLLNKLSRLSETIPPLHEDIYKLYHKILEKFDKIDTKDSKSTDNVKNEDNNKKI